MHKKSIPFSWSFCAESISERNGLYYEIWCEYVYLGFTIFQPYDELI